MLNEQLYQHMLKVYGAVRVRKAGDRARWKLKNGRITLLDDGENYCICCRFCGDTRFRLYVSYTYGMTLDTAKGPVEFPWSAHCFNETACLENANRRKDLHAVLVDKEAPLVAHDVRQAQEPVAKNIVYPQSTIPPTDLPSDHPAIQWLVGRRFDIGYLSERGLVYCDRDPRPNVENTIFIPLYNEHGEPAGGQCRLLYDPVGKFPPRYWTLTHTKTSKHLYGGNIASGNRKLVVVTEGPFDALRVGDEGVASYGLGLSSTQLELLSRWDTVILAYDPDVQSKGRSAIRELEKAKGELSRKVRRMGEANLPPGTDPASLDREELWGVLLQAVQQFSTTG